MTLSIDQLEERMRPGSLSHAGFLGESESLADVLSADAAELAKLNTSRTELADRLASVLDSASSFGWASIGNYDCLLTAYMGYQECPWEEDGRNVCRDAGPKYGSINWTIRSRTTGEKMSGPGLIVHLMREHGFFEGKESPYRVEPARLAKLLADVKLQRE